MFVPRRRLLLLAAGALLAAVVAMASAPRTAGPGLRWVGFNDISIGYHLADPQEDAALSARAGANVSRITIEWRSIERVRGRYDWRPYDTLIAALRARGIRPLLVVMFAPEWAWAPGTECDPRSQDCKYPPGPAHDGDWAAFVASAARRYPDAVAVEVWNEPNLAGFWSPRPDAARYGDLLRRAAAAVRAAAPRMQVLAGGLAPVDPGSAAGIPAAAFLSALYAHGLRGAFDGIGVHLYPCSTSARALGANLHEVRGVRDAAGDRAPIWITELGVSTTGAPPCARRSEQQQAEMLGAVYGQLRSTPDIRAVIVHTLIDRSGDVRDRESGFGVARRDLSPKPAFCVLARGASCAPG